jgi:hypothetical protein
MHLNGAANHPVGEGIKDHLNLLTRSAKSAKKESICPLWADLVPTSAFVVEICYLQFRHFGWGFAALCQGENARPFLSRHPGLR